MTDKKNITISWLYWLLSVVVCYRGDVQMYAQSVWAYRGSLPPVISSITQTSAGTLLCSTPAGAFFSADKAEHWNFCIECPAGRFITTSEGNTYTFGESLWLYQSNTLSWKKIEITKTPLFISNVTAKNDTLVVVMENNTLYLVLPKTQIIIHNDSLKSGINSQNWRNLPGITRITTSGTTTFLGTQHGILSATTKIEHIPDAQKIQTDPLWFPKNNGLWSVCAPIFFPSTTKLLSSMWESDTSGSLWKLSFTLSINPQSLHLQQLFSSAVFLLSTEAVYRYSSSGNRWAEVTGFWKEQQIQPYTIITENRPIPMIERFPVAGSQNQQLLMYFQSFGSRNLSPDVLAVSNDGGNSWLPAAVQGLPATLGFKNVTVQKSGVMVIHDEIVPRRAYYLSHNGGQTWIEQNNIVQSPRKIITNGITGSIHFATTPFIQSNDLGKTWITSKGTKYEQTPPRWFMAFKSGVLYAAFGTNLYVRSFDDGLHYEPVFMPEQTYHLVEAPDRKLYALSGKGIFVSGNDAQTWKNISSGLPMEIGANALTFDSRGNAWLSTIRGFYTAQASVLTEVQEMQDDPSQKYQTSDAVHIYPNPSSGLFSVRFKAGQELPTSYSIVSQQGHYVDLKPVSNNAKKNEWFIDAQFLPQGSFYCVFHYKNMITYKQFIIVR